jgi:DHA1 family bicyclomycin/chloramphenicol resistance-like MFS transporter
MCLYTLAIFPSDNILPSMPFIQKDFHLSTSHTQYAICLFLFGLAIFQPIFAYLNDRWNRKTALLFGIYLFLAGTILSMVAGSGIVFLVGRLFQGIGTASMIVGARIILKDCFSGQHLTKASALASSCIAFTPPLAPMIGGYVQNHFYWQINFALICMITIFIIWAITKYLPETKPIDNAPQNIIYGYKKLLTNPSFMGYTVISGLALGWLMSYITISAFLLPKIFSLSPQYYGNLAIVNGVGVFIGTMALSITAGKFKSYNLLNYAIYGMFVICTFMLLLNHIYPPKLLFVIIPIGLCMAHNTWIFSNSYSLAMSQTRKNITIAASIFGVVQYLCSSIASLLCAYLPLTITALSEWLLIICILQIIMTKLIKWFPKKI